MLDMEAQAWVVYHIEPTGGASVLISEGAEFKPQRSVSLLPAVQH